MKSQKIWFVTLSLLLLVLTAAQAQTTNATEWKNRVATQITSSVRSQPVEKTEAATPAIESEDKAAAAEVRRVPQDSAEFHQDRLGEARAQQKNALAGSWDLTLTFSDGSKVKSTLTVSAGRRDGEGAVIHAAAASLLLPNPTTPEQGSWEHVGGLRFIASYAGYAVDEKFEKPAGKIGFRHAMRLSGDQETFTGRATFEVRDPEGHVVFSDTIRTEGQRQHPEAP